MPVPTDQLAEQLADLKNEVGSLRKDALDRFQQMGDTFDAHLWRIDEKIGSDLDEVKRAIAAAKEGHTMGLVSLREDFARFQTRTDTLIAVANRISGIAFAVFLALIGTAVGVFWGASKVYHTLEFHSQRLEKVERSADYLPKIQETLERLEKGMQVKDRKPEP